MFRNLSFWLSTKITVYLSIIVYYHLPNDPPDLIILLSIYLGFYNPYENEDDTSDQLLSSIIPANEIEVKIIKKRSSGFRRIFTVALDRLVEVNTPQG